MTIIAGGQYGAEDNSNVQYDDYGIPIYYYEWEGKTVTKAEYDTELRKVFNYDKAVSIFEYDDGYKYIYPYEQILSMIADR